jgi:hypothetical protein
MQWLVCGSHRGFYSSVREKVPGGTVSNFIQNRQVSEQKSKTSTTERNGELKDCFVTTGYKSVVSSLPSSVNFLLVLFSFSGV